MYLLPVADLELGLQQVPGILNMRQAVSVYTVGSSF
uniref:Uncharacterized protein n=1 Tax=Anguilla anguilla TaxID=7936 RepID=A0A0E9THS8_ANGAN